MKETINKLRDDEHYYGEFGKQFLSNSDIKNLLEDPASFKKTEVTLPMIVGRYFHTYMLEPEKIKDFTVISCSDRRGKEYKQHASDSEDGIILLEKEATEIITLCDKMKANMDLCDMIYGADHEFEKPGVKEIMGEMWKAKADIVTPNWVVDIKTTADITKFKRSAWTYNYDSQAFIYQEIFGKPMKFIVICKKTGRMATFMCSPEFIDSGRDKAMDAVLQYRRFYGDNPKEDVNNYYDRGEL